MGRMLVECLSHGILPEEAIPSCAAPDAVGAGGLFDVGNIVHLRACDCCHWREHHVKLLVNDGWYHFGADAAAAAGAGGSDVVDALVCRMIEVEL